MSVALRRLSSSQGCLRIPACAGLGQRNLSIFSAVRAAKAAQVTTNLASNKSRSALSASALKALRKDPERPKQPLTPWIRYVQNFRASPAVKHLNNKEVLKTAGTNWKGMNDSARAPFVGPYEIERKQYVAAFKQYVDSGKLDAWKRDPLKPKRPMTGFLLFAQEMRNKEPHIKMTESTKMAGAKWKLLTPEQKGPYENNFAAKFQKYKNDMQMYKDSGKEAAWKKKVGLDAIEQKAKAVNNSKKEKELEIARKLKEKTRKEKEMALRKKELAAAKKLGEKEKQLAKKVKDMEASRKMKVKQEQQAKKDQELAKKNKQKQSIAEKFKEKVTKLALQIKNIEKMKKLTEKEMKKAKTAKESAKAKAAKAIKAIKPRSTSAQISARP